MSNLTSLIQSLQSEFSLTPVMAAEIECYVALADDSVDSIEAFWAPIDASLRADGHPLLRIEQERGKHQFELVSGVTTPAQLEYTLRTIRAWVAEHAVNVGIVASFGAKPFAEQPSSGLHIHLHLANAEGVNAYHKTEDWTSDALRWSLGGLLSNLRQDMAVFFPSEADLIRLDDADHVPKIAGWGVNNRYCALRIPAMEDPYHKRIEHRVPCANAEPAAVIEAILSAVLRGLRERIEPPAQEFGKPSVGLLANL